MSEKIYEITVPQFGVNDVEAKLVEWYISDGDSVSVGEPVCSLVTSKAAFDVEADVAGYIVCLVEIGSEVKINQPIAIVSSCFEVIKENKEQYIKHFSIISNNNAVTGESVKATQKAKDLAQRIGIDLRKISKEGIIREQDVIQHYEKIQTSQYDVLPPITWDETRQPVVIYGAGKGAVTVKECLDLMQMYQVVCFFDDNPEHSLSLCELPVFHSSLLVEVISKGIRALACAIANADVRLRILRQCEEMEVELINVIHPRAYISPTVRMGKGNYVKSNAVIETNSMIGNCCIIDNGVIIAHDNIIGNGCHIAPGVAMGSSIVVGERAIIGIGVSISTGVRIGSSVIVSVGSAVTKDVPDFTVVEGVPARAVGRRTSGQELNNKRL